MDTAGLFAFLTEFRKKGGSPGTLSLSPYRPQNTKGGNTMSTQELTTIVRDLKELRLMAEQLNAEIAALEQAIKAHMEEHDLDTLTIFPAS